MKISFNWLSEFVNLDRKTISVSEISRRLTDAGFEVEEVIDLSAPYRHVVVGQIVEKDKHPSADRLTYCKVVCDSSGDTQPIVCGAKNHNQGDKVVVALPGAVLPGGFAISPTKIRGIESLGMLCSNKELGLDAGESEGIVILPAEAPVGTPFAQFAGLDDMIFELKVTPDRADALSHLGIARELGCLFRAPVTLPESARGEAKGPANSSVSVEISAKDVCSKYMAQVIRGVRITASPVPIQRRLTQLGVRPINNVVDATNYVMLELGQPLHAFDLNEIQGGKILIERAKAGETFVALDESKHLLTGEELTIRDGQRVLALAGVIGGLHSGINDSTKDVVLEAAHFEPASVRRTARKHGIETESSYRFARGVDPSITAKALKRAAHLILEWAGGTISETPAQAASAEPAARRILLDVRLVAQRLGYAVSPERATELLRSTGSQVDVTPNDSDLLVLHPPSHRSDLRIPEDFIEEFARLEGYAKIPEALLPMSAAPSKHDATYTSQFELKKQITADGALESVNMAFTSRRALAEIYSEGSRFAMLGLGSVERPIAVANALSEENELLRPLLLPSLWKNLLTNVRSQSLCGRIFEVGSVFGENSQGEIEEATHLGFVFWGEASTLWKKSTSVPLVMELIGSLNQLDRVLGDLRIEFRNLDSDACPSFFHPGQTGIIELSGHPVGIVGSIHPRIAEKEKLRVPVALAEIRLPESDRSGKAPTAGTRRTQTPSRFPTVERDISLVFANQVPAGLILKEIGDRAPSILVKTTVFDVFRGEGLKEDEVSMAFRLSFQSKEQTLTDDEVNKARDTLVASLTTRFNARLRA